MKRLVIFVVSIIVLLVAIDSLFGYAANLYIKKYGLRGDYQPIEYVVKQCKDDALFIGSSVVINSLMPSVIEDSLGVTCYNTGANSQTMPYFHTVLNCILQRYTPKMIILGLRPDELSGNGIGRYHLLVPYYHTGYNEIDSVLESKNEHEKYLLKSNLYRYNTIWFRILVYHFLRGDESKRMKDKGFSGHEKPLFPPYMTNSKGNQNVSEKKVSIFKDMIRICKERGITLVVYSPPMYTRYNEKTGTVKEIEHLCRENAIHYYYDTQDSLFLNHQEWFYDNVHLNKYGSIEYSKLFASRLKNIQ
ncbi:MAG: hypothetical protein IJ640_13065 [Prevotella sp.]|nr:hypothetical protein [Prevotella sp.]